ncbi:MAG: OB-fold putative lipoprotein [Syntrophales bacterium]|jgi:hypothetical protein|nr:OB-fold putative lipoprotein [Syntrophales bacterium]
MAMEKKCRYCAMMIPKDAKICPHCRKKFGWTWPVKIVVGLIVLGVIGSFMGKNSRETPQAPKPAAKPTEIISITSEQLYKEYEANEVAADPKYKDKTLKVSGTIRAIGKTIGDKPYVNLSTGPFSHQVMVMFPADTYNNQLAAYKKGDAIEVTGTCTGKTLGMVGISLRQ